MEYMEDIASDLSVFHRIDPDDIPDLTAERFFSFALRLVAYKGAIRHTAQNEKESTSSRHNDAPKRTTRDVRTSSSETKQYADIQENQELAVYFERGEG